MEEGFNSEIEECSTTESDEGEDQNYIHNARRRSFVWRYFNEIPRNPKAFECSVCKAFVGAQTCNLSRHLLTVHNITGHTKTEVDVKRGRPSRSFIWKYCTRENEKQAFCHLCKKLLYFGGGNTSNIAKHLRRIHADIIENNGDYVMDHTSPELIRATASISSSTVTNEVDTFKCEEEYKKFSTGIPLKKKERKGCSYVWKYCEKVSKHSVRCRLCNKVMSFHGTANVITHLQRRHNIIGKSDSDTLNATEIITIMQPPNVEEVTNLNNTNEQPKNVGNRGPVTSIVWKYCTRISKDTVRCSFCRKNLSYQGTSNLQRHLHRMHGVIATSKGPVDVPVSASMDLIEEHCTSVDEDRIKCNMCNQIFEFDDTDTIYKHIVVTHGVCINTKNDIITQEDDEILYFDFDDQNEEDLIKEEQIIEIAAIEDDQTAIDIRLDKFYEDIIEEDLQEFMPVDEHQQIVEHPKSDDNNITLSMEEEDLLMQNPLSPQSSEDPPSPPPTVGEGEDSNKRLQELKEDRVRMQALYFREKAGYYRMQKYLAALQARKVRAEMDQQSNTGQLFTETDATIVEM